MIKLMQDDNGIGTLLMKEDKIKSDQFPTYPSSPSMCVFFENAETVKTIEKMIRMLLPTFKINSKRYTLGDANAWTKCKSDIYQIANNMIAKMLEYSISNKENTLKISGGFSEDSLFASLDRLRESGFNITGVIYHDSIDLSVMMGCFRMYQNKYNCPSYINFVKANSDEQSIHILTDGLGVVSVVKFDFVEDHEKYIDSEIGIGILDVQAYAKIVMNYDCSTCHGKKQMWDDVTRNMYDCSECQ